MHSYSPPGRSPRWEHRAHPPPAVPTHGSGSATSPRWAHSAGPGRQLRALPKRQLRLPPQGRARVPRWPTPRPGQWRSEFEFGHSTRATPERTRPHPAVRTALVARTRILLTNRPAHTSATAQWAEPHESTFSPSNYRGREVNTRSSSGTGGTFRSDRVLRGGSRTPPCTRANTL
jgi:hypothetical protein